MRFPFRKQWLLWRTGRHLQRSAPHTAAMLIIFARLYAGEAILSREQSSRIAAVARRGAAWLTGFVMSLAAHLMASARRVARPYRSVVHCRAQAAKRAGPAAGRLPFPGGPGRDSHAAVARNTPPQRVKPPRSRRIPASATAAK